MTTLTLVTVNGCLGMKKEVGVLDNTNLRFPWHMQFQDP